MGWQQLPNGINYYVISEELDSLVADLLSFLFNMSFGWYLLVSFVFMAGLMYMGFRIFSKSQTKLSREGST